MGLQRRPPAPRPASPVIEVASRLGKLDLSSHLSELCVTTGLKGGCTCQALDQLIPLYLTACTVKGKTDRTVQSYDETLRQFQRAGRELGLAEDVAAFGPAHVYLSGLPGALRATGEALVVRLAGGDKDSQEGGIRRAPELASGL